MAVLGLHPQLRGNTLQVFISWKDYILEQHLEIVGLLGEGGGGMEKGRGRRGREKVEREGESGEGVTW